MSKSRVRLPDYLIAEAELLGLPPPVMEVGARHLKVYIDGHLVTVLSHGSTKEGCRTTRLNTLRAIRHFARERAHG